MEHSPHDFYTDEHKELAVRAYLAMGTYDKASAVCGVPRSTIAWWRQKAPWWDDLAAKVHQEMEETYRAGWRGVLEKALDQIADRVANGNWVLSRDGTITRVPVSARDLILVAGIAQDKLRLSLRLPSRIVAREFVEDRLAELRKLAEADRESRLSLAEPSIKKH
jgi:hypothetical protein